MVNSNGATCRALEIDPAMKVLFDGQIFIAQATGGISRYYTMLATGLNAEPDVSARIIAPLHRNEHLSAHESVPVWGVGFPSQWRGIRLCKLALGTLSPPLSLLLKSDIVHETYFSQDPYLTSGKRRVTTVYDMIHEMFYPDSPTCVYKRASLKRCDHAICISNNTKHDLCERLKFPVERASVTHLPYDDFSGFSGDEVPQVLSELPYFLYVGNRPGHKNFELLVRAFARQPNLTRDFRIVCFGGGPLGDDERAMVSQLGLSSRHLVQLSGGDRLLGAAYAHATAFVYPSLYEGFGLPPLEAMSAGCPVLCSNSSSLPEVVGDAALCFDPKDIDALSDAMDRVTQSEDLRQDLVRRGHQRRRLFTRERCVRDTLNVYQSIL